MTPTASVGFGDVLRSHRLRAGFSQEALAERAGLSVDAIGAYERGLRSSPRRDTIAVLIDALQLRGTAREDFEHAARRRSALTTTSGSEALTDLPWQPTSFIGRQREIQEISALLEPRRILTITGSGGIGKTRTALEVASRLPAPAHGIRFTDLASISEERLLIGKLASLLELRLPDRDDLLDAFVASVKTLEVMLILDNCEHIIPHVRRVVKAIISACPHITFLATSRQRLGLPGERVFRLSTLSEANAFELLIDRATEADRTFGFSDEHAEIGADICRKLSGIPLAIELAAARLPLLGFPELHKRLAKHFHVIDNTRHDVPARQQTVRAAIAWSHDLLNETERALFRRLAVFANGWSIEAVETVCGGNAPEEPTVLETLFSLVEKSLVNVDLDAPTTRYSFFESTRAYAMEHLAQSGEGPVLSRLQADWIAVFAERAYVQHVARRNWETVLAPELDNALAALEWALAPEGDDVLAARIVAGLRGFWKTSGLAPHGKRYIETALQRISSAEHPALAARLLYMQFHFLHGSARIDPMKHAISLLEHSDDQGLFALCCQALSFALAQVGRYSEAEEANTRALDVMRRRGPHESLRLANILSNHSALLLRQGRVQEAKTTILEALSISEHLKDDWCISQNRSSLAVVEFAIGDTQRAIALGEESLGQFRQLGNVTHEANILCILACVHLVRGDIDACMARARDALDLSAVTSNAYVHESLQHLATVAALRGEPSYAARLLGFVNAHCERTGYQRNPVLDKKGYDILMESLRKQLPECEISKLAAQGALLSEAAAIEEASDHFASSAVSSSRKLSMSRNER